MTAHERELLLEGPAGSGKTRPILELFHLLATQKPGFRGLICRKVGATLATTCLVTFRRWVLKPQDGVVYFGGSKAEPSAFRYPNGSEIVVGGLDVGADGTQSKVLSSEYDAIYLNEAIEASLEDWETLTTRLRPFVLKHPRLIGDCNPSASKHWLNVRCNEGKTRRFVSKLEDNPLYFDDDGRLTDAGETYIAGLDALTGARYQRLRLGLWVGVENAIYANFSREVHVRDLEPGLIFKDGAIGVDYGRRHFSAVVAISLDQYNRRWVREVWAEPDTDKGVSLRKAVARFRAGYGIRRGRTDPTQGYMAGHLNYEVAEGGGGTRNARTLIVAPLFGMFPGGRVPKSLRELTETDSRAAMPLGPFAEPDSPGILFVKGAPGIDYLCDQIEGYHEVFKQSDTRQVWEVARIDDDGVAAMEYGCEELETEPPAYDRPLVSQPTQYRKARVA